MTMLGAFRSALIGFLSQSVRFIRATLALCSIRTSAMAISRQLSVSICVVGTAALCANAPLSQSHQRGHEEPGVTAPEAKPHQLPAGHPHDIDLPPPYSSRQDLEEQLKNMQRHRAELVVRYTELHPDVRLLDSEMEILLLQIEMAQN